MANNELVSSAGDVTLLRGTRTAVLLNLYEVLPFKTARSSYVIYVKVTCILN
jgi:hypothetical protein